MVTQSTDNHFDLVNSITCRVETPNASGTGVFLSTPDSDGKYFITAKHCLLGKNFDGDFQNGNVTLFVPSTDKENFSTITLDQDSRVYLSTDLDIAIIVVSNRSDLEIPNIPLLDVRWFQQECFFRGYPHADESQAGVNIFVNFVDNNIVTTLTPLETYDTVSHDNCDGFSGSGVFSVIDYVPYFVGLLYELKEPFRRFNIYNLSQINSLLTVYNLPQLPATELPLPADLQQSIHQLERKSELVLETIKDKFDERLSLPRISVQPRFDEVFKSNRLVILKGIAGAGKSAFAKNQASVLQENGYKILAFKADWFAKEGVEEIFPKINHDLRDLLSALGTANQLIILIDSLEKLLEVDTYFALKEFLQICKKLPYVRLIITCRDYAYQQLIFDLHYDFPSYSFIDVPLLSDDELAIVQEYFPALKSLLKNTQFREILKRPFYLNLAIRNRDVFQTDKTITELKFRELIWLHVVAKHSPARATTFEQIAIERATQMNLFVRLSGLDSTSAQELVYDGILEADEKIGDSFRPSHDIYEDIALIRFIERAFQEKQSTENFFSRIGKAPAKRRGFRLWLNDALTEPQRITGFIHDIFDSHTIARFWVDEVIIAILRSEYCQTFFEHSKQLLLENEEALLLRFIHLLRTTCQEPDKQLIQAVQAQNDKNLYEWIYLKPIGMGWEVLIGFINEHFDDLKSQSPLILSLLTKDWVKKIHIGFSLPIESKAAGMILLKIIEDAKVCYQSHKAAICSNAAINKGVETLFQLSKEFEKEARKLIEDANAAKKKSDERNRQRARQHEERMFRRISGEFKDDEEEEEQESNELRNFNEAVVKFVLSGLGNQSLCVIIPDLVCKVAKDQWLASEFETNADDYSLGREIEFGLLVSDLDYFPSGIYKTPARFLLYYHPDHALKLIVDVFNHCTEAYTNSYRRQNNDVIEVEIIHSDGSRTIQRGNASLWGIFRGTVEATHYLLESILMSLESWLLELCQSDQDWAEKWIRASYTYLLKNSTSVAVTAVLASVAQAYPHRVNKLCFPILKVREFFRWDIRRLVGESSALAILDRNIPFAQEGRHQSNQLPHRKFHLEYLVTKLQVEGHFEEISEMIDELVERCDEDDTEWKLALNRMDARRFVIDETVETLEENQIALRPVLDKELQNFVEEHEKDSEIQNRAMGVTNWARSLYDGKSGLDSSFEKWQEAFNTYQELTEFENDLARLFRDPTHLAASGIRLFKDDLTSEQLQWCIETLVETIMQRVAGNIQRAPFSTLHVKPAIETIPEILSLNIDNDIKQEVKQVIFYALLHLVTHESEYPFEAFRNFIWKIDSVYGDACVAGLIQYAQRLKKRKWFPPESKEAQKERETLLRWEEALAKQVAANDITIDLTDLSLDTHSSHYLNFAIQIIPFDTQNDNYLNLLHQLFYLHIQWNNYDRQRQRRSQGHRRNELDYSTQHDLRKYIAQFLLLQNQQVANTFFSDILASIFTPPDQISYESVKYIADILEWIILKQDTLQTESFWELWEILESQIRKSDQKRYVSYLLLSHQWWTSEADNWKPLQNKSLVMRRLVTEFGQYDLKAVMRLLSGIGMEALMPHGLNWLRIVLESIENPKSELADSSVFMYSEKLIRRTYYKYLREIKREHQLQQSMLFLLDLLVDSGSSLAFIVRERLITV